MGLKAHVMYDQFFGLDSCCTFLPLRVTLSRYNPHTRLRMDDKLTLPEGLQICKNPLFFLSVNVT